MTRSRGNWRACILLHGVLLVIFLLNAGVRPMRAQDSALSDGEVEKLRETAATAPDRVLSFVEFVDRRTARVDKLATGKRQPGREEDIHELMGQITSILDDLEDNLDDYSKRHWDVRKVLPKLVAATERWGTALKSPRDDQAYSVQRKLALESLNDVHETAVKMIEEQKAWFAAHPPAKEGAVRKEL